MVPMVLKTKFERSNLDPTNIVFGLGMIIVYVNFLNSFSSFSFLHFLSSLCLSLCCPTPIPSFFLDRSYSPPTGLM